MFNRTVFRKIITTVHQVKPKTTALNYSLLFNYTTAPPLPPPPPPQPAKSYLIGFREFLNCNSQ